MFLIEKLPTETAKDVQSFLEALVGEVYGGRPEWLEYDLRESYTFRDREFICMFCPAGSVYALLGLHASTGNGISRDILRLGTKAGSPCAGLIHRGEEFEFNPKEIKKVS